MRHRFNKLIRRHARAVATVFLGVLADLAVLGPERFVAEVLLPLLEPEGALRLALQLVVAAVVWAVARAVRVRRIRRFLAVLAVALMVAVAVGTQPETVAVPVAVAVFSWISCGAPVGGRHLLHRKGEGNASTYR